MIVARPANERGVTRTDWLDSRHSFSFGEYRDPNHAGFRVLRVMNEDFVKPGAGFESHGHRDMEILTYVLSGAVEHRDNMGNTRRLAAGWVQRMTAGTGVIHGEHNPSQEDVLHLYQIWILPDRNGLRPGYEEGKVPEGGKGLLASRRGPVKIHQNVEIHVVRSATSHDLRAGRYAWVQVLRGTAKVNDAVLGEGDGAAAGNERRLEIVANGELLLFDLP